MFWIRKKRKHNLKFIEIFFKNITKFRDTIMLIFEMRGDSLDRLFIEMRVMSRVRNRGFLHGDEGLEFAQLGAKLVGFLEFSLEAFQSRAKDLFVGSDGQALGLENLDFDEEFEDPVSLLHGMALALFQLDQGDGFVVRFEGGDAAGEAVDGHALLLRELLLNPDALLQVFEP